MGINLLKAVSILISVFLTALMCVQVFEAWQLERNRQTVGSEDPIALKNLEKKFREEAFSVPIPPLRLPSLEPPAKSPTPTALPKLEGPKGSSPPIRPQVKIDPASVESRINTGDFLTAVNLCQDALRIEQASPTIQRMLERARKGQELMELGKKQYFQGSYSEASATFKEVLTISPLNSRAAWFQDQIERSTQYPPSPILQKPTPDRSVHKESSGAAEIPQLVGSPAPSNTTVGVVKLGFPDKIIRGEPIKISITLEHVELVSAVILHYENEDRRLVSVKMEKRGDIFEGTIIKKDVKTKWINFTINVIGLDGNDALDPIKDRIRVEDVLPQAPPI